MTFGHPPPAVNALLNVVQVAVLLAAGCSGRLLPAAAAPRVPILRHPGFVQPDRTIVVDGTGIVDGDILVRTHIELSMSSDALGIRLAGSISDRSGREPIALVRPALVTPPTETVADASPTTQRQ